MKTRRAFTMVEVLITITILVVLAAKEAKGIEHLRQIHQIHMLYQADHGGGGTYGPASQMGLPPMPFLWGRGVGPDWYAAEAYGMTTQLHMAPCGPQGKEDRIRITTWEEFLAYYAPVYKENTSIAVHFQCSPALETDNYLIKRASAVLLSGQAVTKTGYGLMTHPPFFAEPD